MKTARVRTGPTAVVQSIGITHAVLLNTVLLSEVTRIINRLIVGRAARRSMAIADPAVLRHAVTIAGLTDDVVTTAIIDLPIVDRAVVRSMAIADTAVLHRAETIVGLAGDVVTTAILASPIAGRAVDPLMAIADTAVRRRAATIVDSDGRKAWITVVVLRLTSQRVRRSPIVPELAGMAVVP